MPNAAPRVGSLYPLPLHCIVIVDAASSYVGGQGGSAVIAAAAETSSAAAPPRRTSMFSKQSRPALAAVGKLYGEALSTLQ